MPPQKHTHPSDETRTGSRPQSVTEAMFEKSDIYNLAINAEAAKAILSQAEKMHSDLIDDKKSLENKASNFFGSYITIATALIGLGGVLAKTDYFGLSPLPFFVAGVLFIAGCFFFVSVQQSDTYGISGSDPKNWLESGWLDARNDVTSKLNAYLILQYKQKIEASMEANKKKRFRLKFGMYLGASSIATGTTILISFSLSPLVQSLVKQSH